MDNYFIKYNKWLFYKIMHLWFPLQSTNVFYSFSCHCTLKAIERFSRLCRLFQEATQGLSKLSKAYLGTTQSTIWAFQATRCLFQGCFRLPKDCIWVPEATRCLFNGCLGYLKITHRLAKLPRDYIQQASQAT